MLDEPLVAIDPEPLIGAGCRPAYGECTMTIARCVGGKRWTLPAWLLGILAGLLHGSSVHGQSFFDDFNDGNDQGWTHYDVLAPYHPSLAGSFTFPGGNSYRIQTPGNYNPPPLGDLQRGRVGSIVNGSNYSDFRITLDVTDWNKDRTYVFGPIARTAQPGLGTTDGYLLILNSGDNDFQLLRIENEVPHPDELGTVDVELVADTDYRIVYTGLGTQLSALVYDRANLSAPLGAFFVDAANYGPMPVPTPYTSGSVGLIVAQADDPDDVPEGAGPPYGATFDNFRTTVPTVGEWNALGGGNISDDFNWVGNGTPDGPSAHARFLRGAETTADVMIDSSFYTLGKITFDNPNRYKLTGMDMTMLSTADAEIDILSGTHEIANKVTVASKLVIDGPGTLVVSGELDWGGQSIDVVGGKLRLTGASTNHSRD
jgi:hypothetical protein